MQLLALEVKASWGWGLCWNTTVSGPVQANPDLNLANPDLDLAKSFFKLSES